MPVNKCGTWQLASFEKERKSTNRPEIKEHLSCVVLVIAPFTIHRCMFQTSETFTTVHKMRIIRSCLYFSSIVPIMQNR